MESDRVISAPSDGLGDGGQRMRSMHGRTSGPTRRSTKGQWTPEEDEILRKAVQRFKGKNWKKIAECFKDRTDVQCLHRWQKVLNPELVKGPWSKEEDEIIIELVNKYGPKKWSTIAQHLPGRIGKQCRERWHNHLNPAINKEAWTQEEELALIRAHQIYGNRWAELTKFLPGRTDNAIKNHWNSSVKKKLDSYLASGLLEQFQGLPLVGHQNQPLPSSSQRMQSSGDESCPKGGTEGEEVSECSQESAGVAHTHSAGNVVLQTRDQFIFSEESCPGKDRSSSPASCTEQYYTSLEDVTFSIPEIPCEAGCSSKFPEQSFVNNAGSFASTPYQFNLQDVSNFSALELGHQSAGLPAHCISSHEGHEVANVPFQSSMGLSVPSSAGNLAAGSAKPENMLISDDECCRVLFAEAMKDGCFSLENLPQGLNIVDSLLCRSLDVPISESDRTSSSQAFCPSRPELLGTSCSQSFLSGPMLLLPDDSGFLYGREPSQLNCHSYGTQEQELNTNGQAGFICTNESTNSPCDDGTDNSGLQESSYLPKDSLKLVPINTFGSGADAMISCPSVEVKQEAQTEQQDSGALCYEPPRFPSLDIPFFSCDLIQSGNDMLQEYSPLGIRQLMSSMNCITPFRLWDSPSRDGSPEAVLKSAAKTFTGTPSILKKRNRDLLSPLSDRRNDKKLETDLTSCLARDFSRLDVMFDDGGANKASLLSPSSNQKRNSGSFIEDKENLSGGQEKDKDIIVKDKTSEKDFDGSNSQENMKPKTVDTDSKTKIDADAASETVKKPASILVEHNMNDLLFSPDQVGSKANRALGSLARTPRTQYCKGFGVTANQGFSSEQSPRNTSSPAVCKRSNESSAGAVASVQAIPSLALTGETTTTAGNDAGTENYNIFGETPFKRSIESPSAWKSPWFINSFVPGPRVDTEISIEDIGYFMSPGDRSYDALGLMKQLSEHTAAAYADALEVLGGESSETLVNERNSKSPSMDQGIEHLPENENESSHLDSNVMMERRTLDFSECGTPAKGTETRKSLTGVNFSSPSSYLLKGCR
ncbi:transcription factor MYB3R-4 [Citrus sinensis]|uniref:Transcription factor MYB3R-4 n=3 Tax=Citrus sinensis TaxID=2711 RepID=A0ACB8NNS4_CITSI|nr:transcription factor MYB3R-4 [Citrus sinensis]KAH9799513.1 transcription factor MYB3R-4 [Citrus sinensis]